MTFGSEFKEFIARGNVVDLAVGVIIGGAFGKIVTSLVDQVIMPPIGLLMGGIDFAQMKLILKAADPEGAACARFFYEYPAAPGLGHFLHTYVCDGNPVIPTFQGEPERVSIPGDIDDFTRELWENLNPDNKISLFVRYTDLETRKYQQRILNKHSK